MNLLKSQLPNLWVMIANTFQQIDSKSILSFQRLATINPESLLYTKLPRLGKDLDAALENGWFTLTPNTFKRYKGACYPVFLKEYFKEIFEKDGRLRENFNHFILRELRTLCFLFYKFEVPFSDSEKELAYDKFKEIDMSVKTDFTIEQIQVLRRTVSDLLPDDPMDIRPRHSSGATADSYTNLEKRLVVRNIPSLMGVYNLSYFFNGLNHAKWYRSNKEFVTTEPNSKVTLVPKDSRGPRIICMEPHERMFIQKGLMHKIYDHIESTSPAKGRVNFTKQHINQRLAYESSISQKYATIDLKDASDLVSWDLVKQVVPGEWAVALEATRSAFADLPNETVALKKFAPMGSALCFPIEAIVFYAIATQVTPEVWVYGDDIIVPTHLAGAVMDLLEEYGLVVNREKSLYKGFFRESCGGDYYKGQNIVPIRCKSVDLESIYALANSLAEAFDPRTGEAVCLWYDSIMPNPLLRLPISYSNASLLAFFCDRSNEHLLCKRRWNTDHQKFEIRGLGAKQRTKTFHRKDENGQGLLFDYFTNSESSQQPNADEAFLNRYGEWLYNPLRHTFWYGSTSSVYTGTSSRIGYQWVTELNRS